MSAFFTTDDLDALADLNAAELDFVHEIDKLLEEYNSEEADLTKTSNFSNDLVDDLLRNVDIADLEVNTKAFETTELDFNEDNPAILHLEDYRECGTYYDQNLNETNWDIFCETFPLSEQDLSVKQDLKNDDFISSNITKNEVENVSSFCENFVNSNIQQTVLQDKQLSSKITQLNQGDAYLKGISSKTLSTDEIKEMENFSFSLNFNDHQEDFPTTENACKISKNSSKSLDIIKTKNETCNLPLFTEKIVNIQDNTSNSQVLKKKRKKKESNKSVSWNKPMHKNWNKKIIDQKNQITLKRNNEDKPFQCNSKKNCSSKRYDSLLKPPLTQPKNSELQNSKPIITASHLPAKEIQDMNQLGNNNSFVRNNKEFQNSNIGHFKSAFCNIQKPCPSSTSTIQSSPDEDIYGPHRSLNTYNLNKHKKNKTSNLLHYETKQQSNLTNCINKQNLVRKYTNLSTLPVQQDPFHGPNLQFPQTCIENKTISQGQKSDQNIKKYQKILLHYVIKDNLLPTSLNESTIEFSSKKCINTRTRSELEIALKTHGKIENSWWTPDDIFFVTYTLKERAQFVYEMYLKY